MQNQNVTIIPAQRATKQFKASRLDPLVAPAQQPIYFFGNGRAEGTGDMRDVLGGKGAGLAEMTRLGIPVPPGFTIACSMCDEYLRTGEIPAPVSRSLKLAVRRLEEASGRQFGDRKDPLLVSVRSGAAVSMPGMLETVLNLGLNDDTVAGLAAKTNNPRFAYDAYRRFLQMYGSVVMGVSPQNFESLIDDARREVGVQNDSDLPVESLKQLVTWFKQAIHAATGEEFPSQPWKQLDRAIEAVWNSWTLKKAIDYRRVHNIPDSPGTAVSVVAMVYGNYDDESCTGVAFTRNPSTGERGLYGEFLVNAQGEDVVAGIRTPLAISEMKDHSANASTELVRVQSLLEHHFRDMQDIEFTVERGKLYLLQTRNGKRTAAAAVRIAHDLVAEGRIDTLEAVRRVQPEQLVHLLHPVIDGATKHAPLCTGLPASPGAGAGVAVFDPDVAERVVANGEPVVLIREETTPEDFHGIVAASAILTARGGMTSHAAVVARGMGKCAVVGCKELDVDAKLRRAKVGDAFINEGDWITVDGTTGRVFNGNLPTVPSEVMRVIMGDLDASEAPSFDAFRKVMMWADDATPMAVRANADTPQDARAARRAGARGIGLCRTEHMFFAGDRITAMREMILAHTDAERHRALAKLLPMQRADFVGIFEAMDGFPVTIRLLDPPLHEFLPNGGEGSALREANPMLGHRGCRLGITYPEITEMQSRAIFEAAQECKLRGIDVRPEIMIPLVATAKEFEHQRNLVVDVAREVLGAMHSSVPYLVGTMIELPRAAIVADQIAVHADFFSFGTNDLTQTTLGLSRDDAGRFLPFYVENGILPDDPFVTLDQQGVGALITMAVEKGRRVKPNLKIGICGEHGGDPRSVKFFQNARLDYVSCSPFRVPIARLAAAHAAME